MQSRSIRRSGQPTCPIALLSNACFWSGPDPRRYGQRSCEPRLKAEHMAAPTNAAKREESSCQHGAVHTWHETDVAGPAHDVRSWRHSGPHGYAPAVRVDPERTLNTSFAAPVLFCERPITTCAPELLSTGRSVFSSRRRRTRSRPIISDKERENDEAVYWTTARHRDDNRHEFV